MKTKSSLLAVILSISAAFSQLLQAQTSVNILPVSADVSQKSVYETETIYMNANMTRYTKNNTKKRVGYFAKYLKPEFDSCSVESRNAISESIRSKKQATLLVVGGIVTFVTAPFIAPAVLSIAAVGGLVPYTIGLVKAIKAQNQMQKAIWLRNRDVLTRKER
jgi:hypothetical protein